MNSPLITIVVPCYNQGQYLDGALKSILDQTYPNWECIAVNDGSTDNTEEVIQTWCNRDTRFRLICKPNGGLSSARNSGMQSASGDFIQFLDSDDYLAPNKLESAVNELRANSNSDIIISNFRIFSNNIRQFSDPYCELDSEYFNFINVLTKWPIISIPIHCGFFRRNLFRDFRFPEELKAMEDWVMWLYLFKKEPHVVFIDEPLAYYRKHTQSMTKNSAFMEENLWKAIPHIKNIVPIDDYIFYSFLEMQQRNIEISRLSLNIESYLESKTYKYSLRAKQTIVGKQLLKIIKKII